jgi:hypothetical protein
MSWLIFGAIQNRTVPHHRKRNYTLAYKTQLPHFHSNHRFSSDTLLSVERRSCIPVSFGTMETLQTIANRYRPAGPVMPHTFIVIRAVSESKQKRGNKIYKHSKYIAVVSRKSGPCCYGSPGGEANFGPTTSQYFPLKLLLQNIIITITLSTILV